MNKSGSGPHAGRRPLGAVVGAVLCGGASRRMGRDKALIEVGGRALAARVADALRAGGCDEVLAVGGDGPALAALGLAPVADQWPGQGPLAGLATALAAVPDPPPGAPATIVVLAPCDLVDPSPTAVAALITTLAGAPSDVAVAVPERAGRRHWIHAAWRADATTRAALVALVEGGARRLDAVADVVRAVAVPGLTADDLRDADRPGEVPDA